MGRGGGVAHYVWQADGVINLEPLYMPQIDDYESPFDLEAPGFHHSWWSFGHTVKRDHRPYSFVDDVGEEAARVLLRVGAGIYDPEGAGVVIPSSAVAVERIDVRAHLRIPRRGVGMQVVRVLERMVPDRTLYAFSQGADHFWEATGWVRRGRVDDSSSFRPLFVLERG